MNILPVFNKEITKEMTKEMIDSLLKDRIIYLCDDITYNTTSLVLSELLYLDSISNDTIYLYINSLGGSVTGAFAIIDTIQMLSSPVKTIDVGIAASSAALVFLSGAKNQKYMLHNALLLLHQPLGKTQGQESDIAILAKQLLKTRNKIEEFITINSKIALKDVKKMIERDSYINATQAKKLGLTDKIVRNNLKAN